MNKCSDTYSWRRTRTSSSANVSAEKAMLSTLAGGCSPFGAMRTPLIVVGTAVSLMLNSYVSATKSFGAVFLRGGKADACSLSADVGVVSQNRLEIEPHDRTEPITLGLEAVKRCQSRGLFCTSVYSQSLFPPISVQVRRRCRLDGAAVMAVGIGLWIFTIAVTYAQPHQPAPRPPSRHYLDPLRMVSASNYDPLVATPLATLPLSITSRRTLLLMDSICDGGVSLTVDFSSVRSAHRCACVVDRNCGASAIVVTFRTSTPAFRSPSANCSYCAGLYAISESP